MNPLRQKKSAKKGKDKGSDEHSKNGLWVCDWQQGRPESDTDTQIPQGVSMLEVQDLNLYVARKEH